jgi:hypothetical protein
MTATIHPLIDGALYRDPRTTRQQLVDDLANYILQADCAGNPQDAFRAIVWSGQYNVASAAMCFADAFYLAQQMAIAKEMGTQ